MLTLAGFVLLAAAWKVLYQAQRSHTLAVTGLYSVIRHPQYVAFVTIMFSFLVQWLTILTLLMFPVLVWMYARLAKREEQEAAVEFGDAYMSAVAVFQRFTPSDHVRKISYVYAFGRDLCAIGGFTDIVHGSQPAGGYFLTVFTRPGDTWKIRAEVNKYQAGR